MKNASLASRILFWLFVPLAALQGLRLKRTATRLPEAAGEKSGVCDHVLSKVVGNTLDKTPGQNPEQAPDIHLLALGDSIIVGVGTEVMHRSLPARFAEALAQQKKCRVHWRVEGRNGANIQQLRKRIARLTPKPGADIILISIGVNDVTGLSSIRHWCEQMNGLIADLNLHWPGARVLFAGLPPMGEFPLPPQPLRFCLGQRAAILDQLAAALIARQVNMLHIPTQISPENHGFCEDGFHPSAQSCDIWAKQLALQFKADNLQS